MRPAIVSMAEIALHGTSRVGEQAGKTPNTGQIRRIGRMRRAHRPMWRSLRAADQSVWLQRILVVALKRRILRALLQIKVADRQPIELGPHEAAECVLRSADD